MKGLPKLIAESNKLVLKHNYEYAFLLSKPNNLVLLEDFFYGDPVCGLIDKENKWAIVAGDHMTLWTPELTQKYQTKEYKNIHSMRIKTPNTLEILTDPWDKTSAVWEFDLRNKILSKVAYFIKYHGKEYCENIEW